MIKRHCIVICKYCGNEFKARAGNKHHCGDSRDKDTCAGQYRLSKMRERMAQHKKTEVAPKFKMVIDPGETPRMMHQALVQKNNRTVTVIRITAPST